MTDQTPPSSSRRSALAACGAIGLGVLAMAAPIYAALGAVLDPIVRKRRSGGRWVRVAPVSAVPEDGTPESFRLIAARRDAWTQQADEPIGAVYLRRGDDGALMAFSAECPHAGCFVPFDGEKFSCPCHDSTFALDGERLDPATCASPRGLDPLPIDQDKLASGEVWVELKSYQKGIPERIEQS